MNVYSVDYVIDCMFAHKLYIIFMHVNDFNGIDFYDTDYVYFL